MIVLVVGDQKEIAIGDGKHDAKLAALVVRQGDGPGAARPADDEALTPVRPS